MEGFRQSTNVVKCRRIQILIMVFLLTYSLSSTGQMADRSLKNCIVKFGGIERLDTTKKEIYLCFTGHEFNDGGKSIKKSLKQQDTKAHFFFTGDFYRIKHNKKLIRRLLKDGHYLGAHSDKHLLYASWENRDSLLINQNEFVEDVINNYKELHRFGIKKEDAAISICHHTSGIISK